MRKESSTCEFTYKSQFVSFCFSSSRRVIGLVGKIASELLRFTFRSVLSCSSVAPSSCVLLCGKVINVVVVCSKERPSDERVLEIEAALVPNYEISGG